MVGAEKVLSLKQVEFPKQMRKRLDDVWTGMHQAVPNDAKPTWMDVPPPDVNPCTRGYGCIHDCKDVPTIALALNRVLRVHCKPKSMMSRCLQDCHVSLCLSGISMEELEHIGESA